MSHVTFHVKPVTCQCLSVKLSFTERLGRDWSYLSATRATENYFWQRPYCTPIFITLAVADNSSAGRSCTSVGPSLLPPPLRLCSHPANPHQQVFLLKVGLLAVLLPPVPPAGCVEVTQPSSLGLIIEHEYSKDEKTKTKKNVLTFKLKLVSKGL